MNHMSESGAAKTRVSVMFSLGNSQDGLCTPSIHAVFLYCHNLPHYHLFGVNGSTTSSKQLLSLEIYFNYTRGE